MYSWLQIASNDKIIDCCYVNVCYCITLNRISTSQCVLILFLRHTCFWFRINNETNVQHFIYRKNLGYFIQPIFKISSHIFCVSFYVKRQQHSNIIFLNMDVLHGQIGWRLIRLCEEQKGNNEILSKVFQWKTISSYKHDTDHSEWYRHKSKLLEVL